MEKTDNALVLRSKAVQIFTKDAAERFSSAHAAEVAAQVAESASQAASASAAADAAAWTLYSQSARTQSFGIFLSSLILEPLN